MGTPVYTLIHGASGAIIMVGRKPEERQPRRLRWVDGAGDGATQYWNGTAFADREDAAVAITPEFAAVGETVKIEKPADAYVRLPDQSLTLRASFVATRAGRFTVQLAGRYRGEAAGKIVEVEEVTSALQVTADRDRAATVEELSLVKLLKYQEAREVVAMNKIEFDVLTVPALERAFPFVLAAARLAEHQDAGSPKRVSYKGFTREAEQIWNTARPAIASIAAAEAVSVALKASIRKSTPAAALRRARSEP